MRRVVERGGEQGRREPLMTRALCLTSLAPHSSRGRKTVMLAVGYGQARTCQPIRLEQEYNVRSVVTIVVGATVLVLGGCGGANDTAKSSSSLSAAVSSGAPRELGTLKATGFGQADEYVWAAAVVHNNSNYVGQTVTVSFNVLDAGGKILATQAQIEGFSRPSEDHVVGTQVKLEPGLKAAKVEASLDVKASGTFSSEPFPTLPISDVTFTGSGGHRNVTFLLSNPLTVALKSPAVQVACLSEAKSIIGGGFTYPDLVPPGGKIRVETQVIVSGEPKDCTVFVGPPFDWEGAASAPSSLSSPPTDTPGGTPEDAFKVWIQQFGAKDWQGQYVTLVAAQRAVVSERRYIDCRNSEPSPAVSWVKVLSVTDAGNTAIPGTSVSLPSTKVSVQIKANGLKVPVDAHMFFEDGTWKWSMTKENIANCVG